MSAPQIELDPKNIIDDTIVLDEESGTTGVTGVVGVVGLDPRNIIDDTIDTDPPGTGAAGPSKVDNELTDQAKEIKESLIPIPTPVGGSGSLSPEIWERNENKKVEDSKKDLLLLLQEPDAKRFGLPSNLDNLTDKDFENIALYKQFKLTKQVKVKNDEFDGIVNSFNPGPTTVVIQPKRVFDKVKTKTTPGPIELQDITKEEFKKVEERAKKRNIEIDEAARSLGYEVTINEIDQNEDELIVPKYTIKKGKKDPISFLQDKKHVSDVLYEKANPIGPPSLDGYGRVQKRALATGDLNFNGIDFKVQTWKDYLTGEMPQYVLSSSNVNAPNEWITLHYNSLQADYKDKIYNSFLTQLEQKFPLQIQEHINSAGDNILQTESAQDVVNFLNGGIPEKDVKTEVAWERIDNVKDDAFRLFVKQGDKPIPARVIDNPLVLEEIYVPGKSTPGISIAKLEDVQNYITITDPKLREEAIVKILKKYETDPSTSSTKLTREILEDEDKLKNWYKNYTERAIGRGFTDEYQYLYDKRTGKLTAYGSGEDVVLRKEQLIKEGATDEEIIVVESEEEKAAKIKEIRTNLLNFMPENRKDLSSAMIQTYYNVLGLQKELFQQGVKVPGYDENQTEGRLITKPELHDGDGFLIDKYNEEVGKLSILSQSYVLNFDPLTLEKAGFWQGGFKSVMEKLDMAYADNDEVRQRWYEGFIAENPKLAEDFSEAEVMDLYEKTFLNKVGTGLPDFLIIMAEFAITRKLAGTSLRRIGKLAELFTSVGRFEKAAPYIGAFVEELAAIQTVNFTFDQDMSSAFAITGPVGKMIGDFYKAFLNPEATGMFKTVGDMLLKTPVPLKIVGDGVLKVGTSGVVMKVGEIPEAIVDGITRRDEDDGWSHLMSIFDPEEFGVLCAQITATKGIAPVKGIIDVAVTTKRAIQNRISNNKYKAKINEYNESLFGKDKAPTDASTRVRNGKIDKAANQKLNELGVNPRIINTLRSAGLTFKEVVEAKDIDALIKKAEENLGSGSKEFNMFKNALEASKGAGITMGKISEAVKILDAQKGLKLNSEYESFLAAQEKQGTTHQSITLNQFSDNLQKGNIELNSNTLQAFKYLKTPTLIKKYLESYGIEVDNNGKYKSDVLNMIMEPGKDVNGDPSYPNLSYIQEAFQIGTKNNIDYRTPIGQKYINNMVEVIRTEQSLKKAKEQLAAGPVDATKLKLEIEKLEEQKEAYLRADEGIIERAKAENIVKVDKLIDKVKLQKKELGVDEVVKVEDRKGLEKYFSDKVKSIDKNIAEINKEIKSLKPGDPKIKQLETKKENYLKDKKAYVEQVTTLKDPSFLHKGKAFTSNVDGTKEVVFNMADIFKSADPTVAAHELLHPFVNTKIKELGLDQNADKLNTFIEGFVDGLSDNQEAAVKARLEKQGIDFDKRDNLSSYQKLEIFNAYAEALVLGEIAYEPNSKGFKQAAEAFEAFLEKEVGKDITVTPENLKTYINEYVSELGKITGTGRKSNIIPIMIAQGEDRANTFDISVQSSGEKAVKPKLEVTLKEQENKLLPYNEKNNPDGLKPGEEHRIPGIKKNIATIKKLLAKSDKLDKAFKVIDQAINKGGFKDYKEMKSDEVAATSVREAESVITRMAMQPPNGPLWKLKQTFDINLLDQNLSRIDKEALQAEFEGQADVYFSMALAKYVDTREQKRIETGSEDYTPFEVYLKASIGEFKKTDVLKKAKINQENWSERYNEAAEEGYVPTKGIAVDPLFKDPSEVEVKEEVKEVKSQSPFKFNEHVENQVGKSILQIAAIEANSPKQFNTKLDNAIRIFTVDAIRENVAYSKNKKGKMSFDKEKAEKHLDENYDNISRFVEGNSAWFRLRNYDLFYTPIKTESGAVKRTGKEEAPQYITEMPSKEKFKQFFMAEGEFAPTPPQKVANIRSQRLLKYYELLGRIQVGNQMSVVMQSGGNVSVVDMNGKPVEINAFNNLMGYNKDGISHFMFLQQRKTETNVQTDAVDVGFDVQSSTEVPVSPSGLSKMIESPEFKTEVRKVLLEDFGIPNYVHVAALEASWKGETTVTVQGVKYNVEDVKNQVASAVKAVVEADVIPSKGDGSTTIGKSIEIRRSGEPNKTKSFYSHYKLNEAEVNTRIEIGEKAMLENDFAGKGKTKKIVEETKEANSVYFFDYGTKTFNIEKYNNYVDAVKILGEYGLSLENTDNVSKLAGHLGDHSRTTGSRRPIDNVEIDASGVSSLPTWLKLDDGRIPRNIDAVQSKYPKFKAGSKNKYTEGWSLKDIPTEGEIATLNTFLKLDVKDLDKPSDNKVFNAQKTQIKNLLKKYNIDYLDPNAKNLVTEIVLNPKNNVVRTKAMRAKYFGAFDMFWEIPKDKLGPVWSAFTASEMKGSANVKGGTRSLVKLSAAEVNNLSLDQIWEKLEHGDAIANFNATAYALIMNGKRSELSKLIDTYEGYYFSRAKLDRGDVLVGETSKMSELPEVSKIAILPEGEVNIPVSEQKTFKKGEVPTTPTTVLESMNKVVFLRDGKPVKLGDAVFEELGSQIQSSKEKYTPGELDATAKIVAERIYKDGLVKKGEIKIISKEVINEVNEKRKVVKTNDNTVKSFVKEESNGNSKIEISDNAVLPEQNAQNNQFIDEGTSNNWEKDIKKETPEGTYTYDAKSNVATVPNNKGTFSPKRKVVLLAGGAGSGKGTSWENIVKEHPELKDLEIVNSDKDKQRLKKDFKLKPDEGKYDEVDRSLLSRITSISVKEARTRREELIENGDGFVLDGSLASYKANSKLIKELKDKGYDVQIVFTKTDVETASQRNKDRKERSINDRFLRKNHEDVNNTIEQFTKDGETIFTIDGENPYIKGSGNEVFNKLNSSRKIEIKPEENGMTVQSSKEFYEEESNRIISDRYDISKAPMDKATADKIAQGKKGRFRLMGFKAQQAMNLMLEIVPKKDAKALEYFEKGINLADQGRYEFGMYSANVRRSIKDFNREYKDVDLRKKALDIKDADGKTIDTWSRGDAVRMYLWSQNPKYREMLKETGISEQVLFDAEQFVVKDENLSRYAAKIKKLVDIDGEGWVEPYEGWSGTSLKYDINKAIESRRAHYMDNFKQWHDITFSDANIAKIKAGMGAKDFNTWYEAENDFYERAMTNRTGGKNERIGQRFVNWLHGSTALALFGNRKSAFTQLLSTSNFYGAKNNSIFQAASAYGNVEIFDMMRYILKSDYLKDRRGSYDLALKEINELESKFGDLYKKGVNFSFLLSQLGDNAAIVFGGSSMLLNNYKSLMKENPDLTRDQALGMAMQEVALHSERTQQSTWATNLSYQQTKAIGKVTLNFLNTQIRYNNIALEEMKKIKKGVSKDISKSIMRVINYTGLQVGAFSFLSSGLGFIMMDDEENYEDGEYDEIVNTKKQEAILNSMNNIINGTGIPGKVVTTLGGMLQEIKRSSTATTYQKQQAEIAEKALQVSPAISIKYRKLKNASYDIKTAINNYKKGLSWRKPALRATTQVFSAATNIAAPEYVYSLADQYEFIMNERYTFWQTFGAAMGWSLYSMDSDFYKDRSKKEKEEAKAEKEAQPNGGYQSTSPSNSGRRGGSSSKSSNSRRR